MTTGSQLLAGTYAIDPARSTVIGKTRAMFGILPVTTSFTVASGELVVADDPTQSAATATLDAGSFSSGNAKRDHHIASADFLDATAYPTLTFASTKVEPAAGSWTVHGDLTVRDTTRPVVLAIERISTAGRDLRAHATTTLDRHAFGVTKAKGMAGGILRLTLEIAATRV